MTLQQQPVKGRFRVIAHDHYGHSFLLHHTNVQEVAEYEFEKEMEFDPPRYPGLDLVEIHRHAEVVIPR